MICSLRPPARYAGLVLLASVWTLPLASFGQADRSAALGSLQARGNGVMQSVDPYLLEAETVSRHDIIELLAVDPSLEGAKDVAFRTKIWYLDFQFKPMRMVTVDLPRPNGLLKQKLIWYLAYRVTNPGKVMPSVPTLDGGFALQDSVASIRFIPEFRLIGHGSGRVYPDRVIPLAAARIQLREGRGQKLHSTAEILDIKPGETVWGVATWEDVDPEIDRFSVEINGLTNAYRWEDPTGAYKPGDPLGKGRTFVHKTLRLNFWRPGDRFHQHEKEFRYGIPGELDYEWIYR